MNTPETPGQLLLRLMKEHGLSSARVADLAVREVSPTSVRSAIHDGPVRTSTIAAIAGVFPPEAGAAILRAFGREALAQAVEAGAEPTRPGRPKNPVERFTLDYSASRPLSTAEEAILRALAELLAHNPETR